MRISIIAAIGEYDRVMGRDNDLPWSTNLRADKNRFKELTRGHPVIMGRRTWESLDPRFKPLPNRTNIVITSSSDYALPREVVRAHCLFGALERAEHFPGAEEAFLMGGLGIYVPGLRRADRLYITLVRERVPGDVYFPDYSAFSKVIECEEVQGSDPHLTFLTLERP